MTKDEVIQGSLWQITIYAAFQRAKIYREDASNEQKRKLKINLRDEIKSKASSYTSQVSEKEHENNIVGIAQHIDNQHSSALIHGSIPIGVVQKAFNLHLKLLWCLGRIPSPPHCPIDKVIIDKLPNKYRMSWTKIRSIDEYKSLIEQIKILANKSGKSIAQWELEAYEKP